jgi:hypothetical protein
LRRDVFNPGRAFLRAEYDNFSTASLIPARTIAIQQNQMTLVISCQAFLAPILGIGGVHNVVGRRCILAWISRLRAALKTMLLQPLSSHAGASR